MISYKNTFTTLFITILILNSTQTMQAKSVYVISDTGGKEVRAYEINSNSLTYQTTYTTAYTGPVGLSVDETDDGDFLFVTFENQNRIELIDAKTMEHRQEQKTLVFGQKLLYNGV
jgi:6-phosphogluconolactonase (cycloisomerase 2 family)